MKSDVVKVKDYYNSISQELKLTLVIDTAEWTFEDDDQTTLQVWMDGKRIFDFKKFESSKESRTFFSRLGQKYKHKFTKKFNDLIVLKAKATGSD